MTAAAAAAVVAAGGLAAGELASARPTAATLSLSADKSGKLKFDKKSLTAKHGKVTLRMANPSSLPHAIAVQGKGVDKDGKTVNKGGTSTVTATLKKGKYTFYCPVPGHEAGGMKGTLTVT
jgi:plastocyanin